MSESTRSISTIASGFGSAIVEKDDWIKAQFAIWANGPPARILDAFQLKSLTRIVPLGIPTDGTFHYPLSRRRNKENTQAMRQAEENLDTFWSAVDQLMFSKCGQSQLNGSALQQRLLSQLSHKLQRTPEWIEKPPRQQQKQTGNVDEAMAESLYKPFSTLYFGVTTEDEGISKKKTISTSKTKVKTRGIPLPSNSTNISEPTEPTLIKVDNRAYKTFRTLFFNPSVTSSPGEVSWNDFIHAILSTKLFTAEKLYGSAWQFQKIAGSCQSRIQFHEPHPRGKLPFVTARRYGRRLNRAFGWDGGSFVLDRK